MYSEQGRKGRWNCEKVGHSFPTSKKTRGNEDGIVKNSGIQFQENMGKKEDGFVKKSSIQFQEENAH